MKKEVKDDLIVFTLVTLLVLTPLIGAWVSFSYFEAKAFNRITNSDVTTWEAMWVNLRVEKSNN